MLYRREPEPPVGTLNNCRRRHRLCLLVFSLLVAKPPLRAFTLVCVTFWQSIIALANDVTVNSSSVRTDFRRRCNMRMGRIGGTVTLMIVTESNTSVTGGASTEMGNFRLPRFSESGCSRCPNTVLLCDPELFTGSGASGHYCTVLLVAIPTRKLTNATTCPCATGNVPMPWQTYSKLQQHLLLLSWKTIMTNSADTGVE